MSDERSLPARFFSSLWHGITRLRVALSNVLFLLLIGLLFFAFRGAAPEPLPARAALLLNPVGSVVEEKSYADPYGLLFNQPMPEEREILLDDMIDTVLAAADDDAISALVLELDGLRAIGISKTSELAEAIAMFRESGKPVIAHGDNYSQVQYLLAAQADTVIVDPMGSVLLEGFANYQWYFAEALDKLSVNVHVFKAGEHKSIAEPFLRNDMSAGEKAVSLRWLGMLWSQYAEQVEARRALAAGAVEAYINGFAERASSLSGDLAATALEAGLVDHIMSRAEANRFLVQAVGAQDDNGFYQAVDFQRYAGLLQASAQLQVPQPQVATVVASGTIRDGEQPAGSIGGDSLAQLITDAADDPGVVAIVLRVDSGGGSAFASEVVRRKILEVRQTGLPVVVSMGSVAASGGYWIAAAADEIWATPGTLTGSIGVFGAIPTFESLLQRVGVHTDGVATTEVAGAFRTDRALQPEVGAVFQASIDNVYERFVGLIAEGRDMPRQDVYKLATGSVFSGTDALGLGLVDKLGSHRDAVGSAAAMAGLDEDEFDWVIYEQALSPRQLLMQQLLGSSAARSLSAAVAAILQPGTRLLPWQPDLQSLNAGLAARFDMLELLNAPRGIYARCLACTAP